MVFRYFRNLPDQSYERSRTPRISVENLPANVSLVNIYSTFHDEQTLEQQPTVAQYDPHAESSEQDEIDSIFDPFWDAATNFTESVSESLEPHLRPHLLSTWTFERLSSSLPEIFVLERRVPFHLGVVSSITQVFSTRSYRIDRYFVQIAVDERHWQRCTIMAMIPERLNMSRSSTLNNDRLCVPLPKFIQSGIELLLKAHESSNLIRNLYIEASDQTRGAELINSKACRIRTSSSDPVLTYYLHCIREIENRSIPQYLQKDVVIIRREKGLWIVGIGSQIYVEQKVPFREAAAHGQRLMECFMDDIKALHLAQGCDNVAKLAGVVLSDDRRLLLSYLVEAPRQGPLFDLIINSRERNLSISWARREKWVHQALHATVELHKRNIVIGYRPFTSEGIWIDANDDLVIMKLSRNTTNIPNSYGYLPPELRNKVVTGSSFCDIEFNFTSQTDLFQLGLLIWRIAQKVTNATSRLLFCGKECRAKPRYRCTADHLNPVQLPRCVGNDIPAYIDTVIGLCRQRQASKRKPASLLLELIPPLLHRSDDALLDFEMVDVCRASCRPPCNIDCEECCQNTNNEFYQCNICDEGDFDLCPGCVADGITCWDESHTLDRCVSKGGEFVIEPIQP